MRRRKRGKNQSKRDVRRDDISDAETAQAWRSECKRLWNRLVDMHPTRLLQALNDDALQVEGWTMANHGVQQPLVHAIFFASQDDLRRLCEPGQMFPFPHSILTLPGFIFSAHLGEDAVRLYLHLFFQGLGWWHHEGVELDLVDALLTFVRQYVAIPMEIVPAELAERIQQEVEDRPCKHATPREWAEACRPQFV